MRLRDALSVMVVFSMVFVLAFTAEARPFGPGPKGGGMRAGLGGLKTFLELKLSDAQQVEMTNIINRPREAVACRGRIAFVEYEIDHRQYGVEPFRQIGQRGDGIRNARIPDFGFASDDSLCHRSGRRQEGVSDFLGRQSTDFT